MFQAQETNNFSALFPITRKQVKKGKPRKTTQKENERAWLPRLNVYLKRATTNEQRMALLWFFNNFPYLFWAPLSYFLCFL